MQRSAAVAAHRPAGCPFRRYRVLPSFLSVFFLCVSSDQVGLKTTLDVGRPAQLLLDDANLRALRLLWQQLRPVDVDDDGQPQTVRAPKNPILRNGFY